MGPDSSRAGAEIGARFWLSSEHQSLIVPSPAPPSHRKQKKIENQQVEEHEAHQYEGEGVGRRESLRPDKPAATAKKSEEEAAKGAAK